MLHVAKLLGRSQQLKQLFVEGVAFCGCCGSLSLLHSAALSHSEFSCEHLISLHVAHLVPLLVLVFVDSARMTDSS